MNRQQFEQTTRTVFDEIHRAQGDDQAIFKRLTGLLDTEYLGVEDDWFTDKICLDAGCGSNANATYAMLRMGAEKVYAFDLDSGTGDTILQSVPSFLEGFEGKYHLSLGNVLDMEFPDGFFDFTHCAGVLHHTSDMLQGLEELARVTKQEGTLYVLLNGIGGLARDFTEFLRRKYQDDGEFRALIDGVVSIAQSNGQKPGRDGNLTPNRSCHTVEFSKCHAIEVDLNDRPFRRDAGVIGE